MELRLTWGGFPPIFRASNARLAEKQIMSSFEFSPKNKFTILYPYYMFKILALDSSDGEFGFGDY